MQDAADVAAEPSRRVNENQSFKLGLNHVTQVYKDGVFQGWELTCHHPDHKCGSSKCRKKVKAKTRDRSQSLTLKMLETWSFWGCSVASRKEHADLWKAVVQAAKDGTLPQSVPPVTAFTKPAAAAKAKPVAKQKASASQRAKKRQRT